MYLVLGSRFYLDGRDLVLRSSGARRLAHSFILVFEEEFLLSESGFQVIEPGGFRVESGKERPLHPLGIAGLNEAQHKDLLIRDLCRALYLNLARPSAH